MFIGVQEEVIFNFFFKFSSIFSTKQPYLNDDAPYSCCDPNKTRPCIHHHIHDNDLHFNYDFKTELTLYKTGCTTALMSFFGDVVLKDVGIVVLCISFIEVSTKCHFMSLIFFLQY